MNQPSAEETHVRRFASTFAANATAPREARRMVEAWSDQVDREILHTLRLLVSEVIALSVRNGDIEEDGEPPVELSVDFDARRVRVEAVRDSDRYLFPMALVDLPDLSLALIDELSDRWGICRGDSGTLCWLEIDGWPGAFSFSRQ